MATALHGAGLLMAPAAVALRRQICQPAARALEHCRAQRTLDAPAPPARRSPPFSGDYVVREALSAQLGLRAPGARLVAASAAPVGAPCLDGEALNRVSRALPELVLEGRFWSTRANMLQVKHKTESMFL